MTGAKGNAPRWTVILGALAAAAAGVWLVVLGSTERVAPVPGTRDASRPAAASPGPPATPPDASASPRLRLTASDRLVLAMDDLPDAGPLVLSLDLDDAVRGSSDRVVRVVSTDGRRLETTASLLPGAGSGVRLEIDRGFLSPGLYMIEVDTDQKHPLHAQRYVMELK